MLSPNHKVLAGILVAVLLAGTVGALVSRAPKTENIATVAAITQTENTVQQSNDLNTMSDRFLNTANDETINQRLAAQNLTNDSTITAYRNGFDDGYKAARKQRSRMNIASENVTSETIEPQRATTRTRFNSRTRYTDNRRHYYQLQSRRSSFVQRHRNSLTVANSAGAGALRRWFS